MSHPSTQPNNIVVDLYKWRKPLVLFTCFAVILGVIVSSPYIITPKFKSTAVVYPTTTNSISQALLVEHNPYKKDVLEFGEELEAERLLQILNSDEMKFSIISEFDLFAHYEINVNDKHANTWMDLAFKEHFSFKRTELMSVKIEVLDKSPKLASEMANRIVDLIDQVIANVKRERAHQAIAILERRDHELAQRLFSVNDSLVELNYLGIIDVPYQTEKLTESYAQALSQGNTSGARAVKKELDHLAKYAGSYTRLIYEQELLQEQVEVLRLERENVSLEDDAMLTNRFVINRAIPADKKAYPIRWLIVVLSGIGTFVMTLVLLYVKQTISRVTFV